MIKKILRELYLLPRGEQRALLLLSLLLLLGIVIRATVQLFPSRDPPGMEDFIIESRTMLAAFAEADSLRKAMDPSTGSVTGAVSPLVSVKSGSRSSLLAQPVDINRADSAQLLPLPGIGPVFAGRIIKYRNLLGGFVSTAQLEEVYGLKPETIEKIRDYLFLDTTAIRKIMLDTASFRELLRHPYLGIDDVKALLRYRDFKGQIGHPDELKEFFILPDSTLERIRPYL